MIKKTILSLTILSSVIFSQIWIQIGGDIDGEAEGDWSGWSVSLSSNGSRVAIGAVRNGGAGYIAGHVRVYSESEGIWSQVGSDINGEAVGDKSGSSVALSSDGKRVAVGAQYNDGTGNDAGHVRIYSESGGEWTQNINDIDGETADDRSGVSLSLSSDGNRIAIGAFQNDGTGSDAGHVRIYTGCINGSIIYNTGTGKFNFCEDGVWVEK